MGLNRLVVIVSVALLAVAGCTSSPFRTGMPGTSTTPTTPQQPGGGPVVTTPEESPAQLPRRRSRRRPRPSCRASGREVAPATLGTASKALVSQAQAQRQRGDLPGAAVSLERALRIEPNNPLLWIEMGRLRMDQTNFPQAESMGRKALSMSVGDDRTQSLAWQLISDSLKARGKNPQAQDALERSKALAPH